jgi:hypothetical protein
MNEHETEAWESLRRRKSQVKEVPLTSVYVDARFQRALNPNAVHRIKDEYHPQGVGQLLLAGIAEDGTAHAGLVVIDGQTRFKALEELHHEVQDGRRQVEDLTPTVVAEVFDELTVAEAALLFRLRNAQRPVPPKERDRIMVSEGNPEMVEVVRQSEAAGYRVFTDDEDNEPVTMPHLEVAKRIVRWGKKYSRPELLTEALNVQAQAFGQKVGDVDKQVLGATADLLRKNANLDDSGELVRVLSTLGLPGLRGQAEARASRYGKRMHGAIQLVIIEVYNKGKRGKDEKIRY